MKKKVKKIFIFSIILISFLLICPISTCALIKQSINNTNNLKEVSDITFNAFNQISNLSILDKDNINNIQYYLLSNETNDNVIGDSDSLTPSKNYKYKSYDYVIDKYDVNVVVNENNVFEITETITAYFNVPKHGIYRTIPLKNTIVRLNGTTSINYAKVKDISVDNEYSLSKVKDYYKIQIGNVNKTLTGEQKYVIKYKYNLGKDSIKDYDELYYNLIGNEWDTVIGNITFTIIMPKEFEVSKLGFSSGKFGSISNNNIKYNVNGNTITGSYNNILEVGEALTIRCELPEGYFVNASFVPQILVYLMFIIPILSLIISLILWYKYGRDSCIVETIEFNPPEGLNSLEVGFMYKGKATNKDVTSLLIALANKGFIEISDKVIEIDSEKLKIKKQAKIRANKKITSLQNKIEEEKRINPNSKKIKYYENMLDIYKNINNEVNYENSEIKSNKKNNFIIKKIKEYNGTNINEKIFFDGLFKSGREEVTERELINNFYITNSKILDNMNKKENISKILEKNTLKKIIIMLLIAISTIIIIAVPILEYSDLISFLTLAFVCAIFTPIIIKLPFIFRNIFIVIAIIILLIMLPIKEIVLNNYIYTLGFIIGIICLIGMILFSSLMPKRTKYGIEILGKIKGFKTFLETVEKEKLETIISDNPNYFYDILPYTYVLGISDKWIKKFESITLMPPYWYNSSYNTFDISTFETFINSTIKITQNNMRFSLSNFSSGGFSSSSSGGGISGGGSGGGGGGSW